MSFTLLHDLVAIKQSATEISEGGIVLSATEELPEGTVVATGPGRYLDNGELIETNVSVGDKVMFAPNSGQETEIEGETYLVMTVMNIIGILK